MLTICPLLAISGDQRSSITSELTRFLTSQAPQYTKEYSVVLILEAALAIWIGFGIKPRRYLNFVGQVPKFSDVSVCKGTECPRDGAAKTI